MRRLSTFPQYDVSLSPRRGARYSVGLTCLLFMLEIRVLAGETVKIDNDAFRTLFIVANFSSLKPDFFNETRTSNHIESRIISVCLMIGYEASLVRLH